jgi:uncharacterized protein YaaQ
VKLLMCIVQQEDASSLMDALAADGYRTTVVSTTGGFLRQGNATLLSGVPDEDVHRVLKIVQANCRTRAAFVHSPPPAAGLGTLPAPMPLVAQVGGAVVFVLDVERFEVMP